MNAIRRFVQRRPVAGYCVLVFAISWGGVLAVTAPGAMPATPAQAARLFPAVVVAMLAGPSLAGLLLTALVAGKAGFRELAARLLAWRVGIGWYAFALLAGPLAILAAWAALSTVSPAFAPALLASGDLPSTLVTGLAVAVGAGLLEELGWTGFAVPRLRLRHGILATGLMVGAVWGAWHFLSNVYWESGTLSGELPIPAFLAASGVMLLVGQLPAFRVLMVWVYDRTESLLVAMLMHWSLTAATLILGPAALAGRASVTYGIVLSIAAWAVTAAVILVTRGRAVARGPRPAAAPRAAAGAAA